jgi:hypothetical protein
MFRAFMLVSLVSTPLAIASYSGAVVMDSKYNDDHAALLQVGIDSMGSVETALAVDSDMGPDMESNMTALMTRVHEKCNTWILSKFNPQKTFEALGLDIICDEVTKHEDDYESYRSQALNHTALCVMNKMTRTYEKMCEVCAHPKLKETYTKSNLLGDWSPCVARFSVLNRIFKGIMHPKTRNYTVEHLLNVSEWLEVEALVHPESWEAAWDDDKLAILPGLEHFADLNRDGNVTKAEVAIYLKAAHVLTQVVPEALIRHEAGLLYLARWGEDDLSQGWVGGGLYDAEWLSWPRNHNSTNNSMSIE